MPEVHWARHGENVANLSRTFSYRVFDGDLTDRGIAQAEHLAETLRAARPGYGLLVCSPLRRARQVYQATLAAWRSGQLEQRFPAGESGCELATRIGRALRAVADEAGAEHAVVVAHGASIRAAVPALTGQPEPGTDLATGGVAR